MDGFFLSSRLVGDQGGDGEEGAGDGSGVREGAFGDEDGVEDAVFDEVGERVGKAVVAPGSLTFVGFFGDEISLFATIVCDGCERCKAGFSDDFESNLLFSLQGECVKRFYSA